MFFPAARMRLGGLSSALRSAPTPFVAMRRAPYALRGASVPSLTATRAVSSTAAVDSDQPPRKRKSTARKTTTAKTAKKPKAVKKLKKEPKPKKEPAPKKPAKFVIKKDMRPPQRIAPRALSVFLQERILREGAPKSVQEAMDLMKSSAAQFKVLPESEKLTYATAAAKIGEERAARYAEWTQRPDARKILDVLNARRIKRGAKRIRLPVSLRKRMPPTAYTLFIKEHASEKGRRNGLTDAASHWRTLSDKEKAEWTERAAVERAKWERETKLGETP